MRKIVGFYSFLSIVRFFDNSNFRFTNFISIKSVLRLFFFPSENMTFVHYFIRFTSFQISFGQIVFANVLSIFICYDAVYKRLTNFVTSRFRK